MYRTLRSAQFTLVGPSRVSEKSYGKSRLLDHVTAGRRGRSGCKAGFDSPPRSFFIVIVVAVAVAVIVIMRTNRDLPPAN